MASTRIDDQRSVGELLSDVTQDLGQLVRKEIELAKSETREEIRDATRAGAMFGVAGVVGFLALLMLSFAVAWGLAEVMPAGVAFLIVGIVDVVIAAIAVRAGRERFQEFDPVPHETIDTLKEDVQWARARKS
jgi:Putative Actinobacterial Holin-X, holin superfamily III